MKDFLIKVGRWLAVPVCAVIGAVVMYAISFGLTYIVGTDMKKVAEAKKFIETIIAPPKIGSIYCGRVVKIMDFGAFVEISPGKEGLLHISKISMKKIKSVSEVLKVGDEVMVKIMEIDSNGKISLSRKDAVLNLD